MSEFSQLSDIQERYYIFDVFITGTFGLTLAIFVFVSLKVWLKDVKQRDEENNDNNNTYYQNAIKCTMISVACSMIYFLLKIFFMNDMLIPWHFDSQNNSFVSTIVDAILIFIFTIEKIFFYYGFTFYLYVQLLTNNEKMGSFIKIIMFIMGIVCFVLGLLFVIDDSLITTPKEIGKTETRNIYITMYLGHEGADLIQYLMMFIIIVDFIYFIVLFSLYIRGLKQIKKKKSGNDKDNIINTNEYSQAQMQTVKGIILMSVSSIVFWICMLGIGLNWDIKYLWDNMQLICDDICLFLLVKNNQLLYNNLCFLCNKCIKISQYQKIDNNINDDENEDL